MIVTPLLIAILAVLILYVIVHASTETEHYRAHAASHKALEDLHTLDVCDDTYRLPVQPVYSKAYSAHPAYQQQLDAAQR